MDVLNTQDVHFSCSRRDKQTTHEIGDTGVSASRSMQCRLVKLLSVICLCLRSYVVYCSCTYKEHWIRGSYQIPTMDNPYTKMLSGLTLYECLATCFVNTESCRSFNYWANSSVCEFFAISLKDNENEEEGASVHAIYTDMATMPPVGWLLLSRNIPRSVCDLLFQGLSQGHQSVIVIQNARSIVIGDKWLWEIILQYNPLLTALLGG